MPAVWNPRANDIFLEALDKPATEREAFLGRACVDEAELREQVRALLAASDKAGSFLQSPPSAAAGTDNPTFDQPMRERPGMQIGPYKLLQQIGEGGFGIVFMAEQTEPVRRRVAVKVIKPGMDTRQVIARFEAERQALAVMDHPNIARVIDAGATESGRPYFVMELVRGIPITQYCDENNVPVRKRLALFASVCLAIQHAHTKGIIHRDIKPTNVLITQQDGEPVVKVIDFGIAKAMGQQLTEKTLFTEFAQMIGTPLYMSPEQAAMSSSDVDTRSDIYSLGVLLYELLTGSTPVGKEQLKHAAFDEIRRIIREEEPPKPSTRISHSQTLASLAAQRHIEPARLSRLVRGELDWIVMKCLEKDRNRRYETANGLAADIERYLNDEAVQACPPSSLYRLRKMARRHKGVLVSVLAMALAILLAVAALAISTGQVWRANQDLRTEVYFQRITLAHRELSVDNLHGALKFLDECPQDLRDWEWHYLMRFCKVEPLVLSDKTEVNGLAFSPDGQRLASAGSDGSIKIWNSRTGAVVQTIEKAHSDAVVSVAFHRDGRHLASRGADLKVKVWDLTAPGQAVFTEPSDAVRKFGSAYSVAFSSDGRLLAAGSEGKVKVWDWRNRKPPLSLTENKLSSMAVAFSGDGRLATGSFREPLRIWNPETGELLGTIPAHQHPVSALAFSRDGQWLASAAFRGGVKLSNATTGRLRHTFDLHTGNVECVAFSPSGRLLASGGEDKTVRIWDATTGREVLALHGHTERCACVAFSPDGLRLASASADRTIRIWDGTPLRGDERGQEILTFTEHSDEIRSVAFSPDGADDPDGQRIASAGDEGLVKIWDAETGQVTAEFSGHDDFSGIRAVVFGVAWHPQGHTIASASVDTVRVWDARTARKVFPLPAVPGKVVLAYQAVAFSPDGRYLVTGNVNGAVQVWDGGTGEKVGTLDTHKREIRGVVFNQGGEHLASASSDGIVKIWDAQRLDKQHFDGKTEPCIPPIQARVAGPGLSVAFSPDGRRLATGGETNTVKIWDVQTGQPLRTLEGHKGEVYTVAFSPVGDGRWVASAGGDSTVKIWDSHAGTLVRSFRGHTGLVSSLSFSPDGRRLVSGSRDKTVKVWDMTELEVANDR